MQSGLKQPGRVVTQKKTDRTGAPVSKRCPKTAPDTQPACQGNAEGQDPRDRPQHPDQDLGLKPRVCRGQATAQLWAHGGCLQGSARRSRGLTFAIWTTLGNSVRQEMGMTSWYVRHLVLGEENPR